MGAVEKWLSPEGLMLIECWARDGLNTTQIAHNMGVSRKTLWEWRNFYEEIDCAFRKGKETVDYEVENALLKLALGGEKKTTRTIVGNPDSNGNRQVRVETTVESVLPNVTAALAWLNNRRPKNWKRNRDLFELTNDEDSNVTINVVRAGSALKTQYGVDAEVQEKPKRVVDEKRERTLRAREKRKRGEEEYEKAMARIEKDVSSSKGKGKKNALNKSNNKAEEQLDENGWPLDWQDDDEW